MIKNGQSYQLVPCLLSLEDPACRAVIESSAYPGCIIGLKESGKTSVHVFYSNDTLTVYDDADLKASCARCRVFEESEWKVAKYLDTATGILRFNAIQEALNDAFDFAHLKEPKIAELLGQATFYYTFSWKSIRIVREGQRGIPKEQRKAVAAARNASKMLLN